ncbi:hypothetical protein B0A48_07500 [Cryoendolithus antarcticus]|uniref:Uncharacterized protein n=1 Tax=Cryoendolithus antarcticus TaxID=1507870 RepID=A0A1V8T6L6_9PEZI|nr:hypothetical protein B0A48_07500 [Cryoendolithus antarcticus]
MQVGNPASALDTWAHPIVHHTTDPASPQHVNASLKAWVGAGNDLRHLAPGLLLVSGHKGGEDKEGDRVRDFEMKDLKVLKALLPRPWEERLVKITEGGTNLKRWLRMNDHKLICKPMRDMPPRPSARHIRVLYFPATGSKPRLLWMLKAPPGSKADHLNDQEVARLISDPYGSARIYIRNAPETTPGLIVHFSTKPGEPTNAILREWIGEQRMKHYAPGPILVSGHRGGHAERDVHRDFEMEDLVILKMMLQSPMQSEYLQKVTHGGRDFSGWLRA